MKSKPEKCYLLMSVNEPIAITICSEEISNCRTEKLLGVTFSFIIIIIKSLFDVGHIYIHSYMRK